MYRIMEGPSLFYLAMKHKRTLTSAWKPRRLLAGADISGNYCLQLQPFPDLQWQINNVQRGHAGMHSHTSMTAMPEQMRSAMAVRANAHAFAASTHGLSQPTEIRVGDTVWMANGVHECPCHAEG
jgi:hypothetical protein